MIAPAEKNIKGKGSWPIHLKADRLQILVVGDSDLVFNTLKIILANSPEANLQAAFIRPFDDPENKRDQFPAVEFLIEPFQEGDMDKANMVIITSADEESVDLFSQSAKAKGKLVSVAGNPDLSDFDFEIDKSVITEMVSAPKNGTELIVVSEKRWKQIASYFLFAFFFMIVGHAVLSFVPFPDIALTIKDTVKSVDNRFYWMMAAGFLAQLVDGALGMGYGVVCTTMLLSIGVNLPAISGSIHTAEMFSSGISGYSHYKFGNVNKLLFKRLLIPGIIGAIAGAMLLSNFGDAYAVYFRPALAAYTLFLGIKIITTMLKKNRANKKVKRIGWLAGAGGFLDSFGGGGWGPLVTSTLISKGKSPRYVIGSVSVTEFFVTLASAVTFFGFLGISHWQVILGLIVGGTIAAPFAARLAGKLPMKAMFLGVGGLVIIWSLRILAKSVGVF